jgi:hypothetical protein
MSTALPWDRWQPEPEPEPEPPPPVRPPVPAPEVPYEEELPYVPPPRPNLPDRPTGEVDFGKILKDAFAGALVEAGQKLREGTKDYAKDTWEGIKKGETVDILNPTITAETKAGRELVVADAKSRSWRTLWQGLIVDVFAAILAVAATLSGMDPLVKETWILIAALLVKSVLSAIISYFMRLKVTPTIRTPGEKMAIMPLPRPMVEETEWEKRSA